MQKLKASTQNKGFNLSESQNVTSTRLQAQGNQTQTKYQRYCMAAQRKAQGFWGNTELCKKDELKTLQKLTKKRRPQNPLHAIVLFPFSSHPLQNFSKLVSPERRKSKKLRPLY